jgi:hypothetical protein
MLAIFLKAIAAGRDAARQQERFTGETVRSVREKSFATSSH